MQRFLEMEADRSQNLADAAAEALQVGIELGAAAEAFVSQERHSSFRFVIERLGGEVKVAETGYEDGHTFDKEVYDLPAWLGAIAYCAGTATTPEELSRLSAGISWRILKKNDWGEGQ